MGNICVHPRERTGSTPLCRIWSGEGPASSTNFIIFVNWNARIGVSFFWKSRWHDLWREKPVKTTKCTIQLTFSVLKRTTREGRSWHFVRLTGDGNGRFERCFIKLYYCKVCGPFECQLFLQSVRVQDARYNKSWHVHKMSEMAAFAFSVLPRFRLNKKSTGYCLDRWCRLWNRL